MLDKNILPSNVFEIIGKVNTTFQTSPTINVYAQSLKILLTF